VTQPQVFDIATNTSADATEAGLATPRPKPEPEAPPPDGGDGEGQPEGESTLAEQTAGQPVEQSTSVPDPEAPAIELAPEELLPADEGSA
jgi:hypothetical protein